MYSWGINETQNPIRRTIGNRKLFQAGEKGYADVARGYMQTLTAQPLVYSALLAAALPGSRGKTYHKFAVVLALV